MPEADPTWLDYLARAEPACALKTGDGDERE